MVAEAGPQGLRWGVTKPVGDCQREPFVSLRTGLGLGQPWAQGQTRAGGTSCHSFSQKYLSYLPGSVEGDGDAEGLGQLGLCRVASAQMGRTGNRVGRQHLDRMGCDCGGRARVLGTAFSWRAVHTSSSSMFLEALLDAFEN